MNICRYKNRFPGLCFLVLTLFVAGCATSPTGQRQLKLFPDSQMAKMGVTAFEDIKKNTPRSNDPAINNYVSCVANAVYKTVDSSIQWELVVFDDPAVNAFALPGGKIGVYTGLLNVASNQHQLAAVIGHEIAHVLADHGNARVSTAYATQTGLQLAQILSGAPSAQKTQLLGLLGLGAQYGVLMPYGRSQESESDILGLQMMARAGFNPEESVTLWKNMAKAAGKQPPEFLSTHPSSESRIKLLSENMPAAKELYKKAQAKGLNPECENPLAKS
ncbi:MAG: M48 family metallopeptidase [Gammaproteobacteria bacterium]|nr:M48 family metallopeptidase [Gammaproteobacteria bacterium]